MLLPILYKNVFFSFKISKFTPPPPVPTELEVDANDAGPGGGLPPDDDGDGGGESSVKSSMTISLLTTSNVLSISLRVPSADSPCALDMTNSRHVLTGDKIAVVGCAAADRAGAGAAVVHATIGRSAELEDQDVVAAIVQVVQLVGGKVNCLAIVTRDAVLGRRRPLAGTWAGGAYSLHLPSGRPWWGMVR